MRVEIEKLGRGSFMKAKTEFSKTWPDRKIQYWEDFGKANNLKVIITEVKHGFPVIDALEFNDEQSYIWFMMRWL
jgi:hypothetical protein